MKVQGLIVEYNPFHNGHLYHIEESRKSTCADFTVCVMSGNFIQRGEPAIIDKWFRTRIALVSGAGLIIELPLAYSMSSAESFAFGAVKVLDSLGIVDNICFGSETGNIEELDKVAGILHNEPEPYKILLKDELKRGVSFPTAREAALKKYIGNIGFTEGMETIITSSNCILGVEYLKALKTLKSDIIPATIKRTSNSYNSETLTGKISSATSIRKHISDNLMKNSNSLDWGHPPIHRDCPLTIDSNVEAALPKASFDIIQEAFDKGIGPIFPDLFGGLILSTIRKMSKENLKNHPYVNEGLENRIKEAANECGSFSELVETIGTKRYTRTRIQRILFSILIGLTVSDCESFARNGGPQYIRVLGFNENGRNLLSIIKKHSYLPIIVKTADFKHSNNHVLRRMLEIESLSTDLYVLGYNNPEYRKAGQDFTRNPVRV